MRKYKVKLTAVISIEMDDTVEPYDFEEGMSQLIESDLNDQGWEVKELDIEDWGEIEKEEIDKEIPIK